jgi:hypothetical protein
MTINKVMNPYTGPDIDITTSLSLLFFLLYAAGCEGLLYREYNPCLRSTYMPSLVLLIMPRSSDLTGKNN